MSDYEVRDPQRSTEWTKVEGTFNAWASVRAFLKIKGYPLRGFVGSPRTFEVRHPSTDPAKVHEVRVSVSSRIETHVRHHGAVRWTHVGRPGEAHEERDKAWARLVRATDAAATSLMAGPYNDRAATEYEAARQALRDLGIDVDALLGGTS